MITTSLWIKADKLHQLEKLSQSDRKILRLLQADTTRSRQELADEAGMSSSSVWRKINELETLGAITKRVALLDPNVVGLSVCAILSVNLHSHENDARHKFERFIQDQPEIMECFVVTGAFDYMLIVRASTVQELETFLMGKILGHESVATTSSQIALSQTKYTTQLPI